MKNNQLGQFKLEKARTLKDGTKLGSDDHPRFTLSYDKDNNIVWLNNLAIVIEQAKEIEIVQDVLDSFKLLTDLQTGTDCFCADEVNDGEIIHLYGSGWMELGYPFFDDKMTPETATDTLYEGGSGCYAYLTGKTAKKFYKLSKQDQIPDFETVFSGKWDDLKLLKEKVEA